VAPAPTSRPRAVRHVLLLALGAGFVFLFAHSGYAIIWGGVGSYPHSLQTVVPSAFEVIPGERVVLAGEQVGEVTGAWVNRRGEAHIVMGLENRGWPVPRDSQLALMMGGTIKYTDRFITITEGHAAADFPDHGYVPARQFTVPVEYDQLFNVFTAPVRRGLGALMVNGSQSFTQAERPFRAAVAVAGPALDQVGAVFGDLGADPAALSALVRSTSQLTGAIATANPGLRTLLAGAASTFTTVAGQSRQLGETIDSGTRALTRLISLARHGSSDLPRIAALTNALSPVLGRLQALRRPLTGTLADLVAVEPSALDTLDTLTRSGPTLQRFLARARTPLLTDLAPAASGTATVLNCVRPYTPDLLNFFWTWAGWNANGLTSPHIRVAQFLISFLPFPNNMPINTVQMHELFPQLSAGTPTVPGAAWGQTWYQPACGTTPLTNTPAGDSENNTFDPLGQKAIFYPSTTPTYGTPGL
jgi:phospholipid/cholesterol/gamma-HCH transport system substrate-binding protein